VPSPVVEHESGGGSRNGIWSGSGLELVDALTAEPSSRRITCCRACAGTCWQKSAARMRREREFERAAALTRNTRERELLLNRARTCAEGSRRDGYKSSRVRISETSIPEETGWKRRW